MRRAKLAGCPPGGTPRQLARALTDIEAALLAEAGLLSQQTIITTTVHDLQVLDEDLPEQPNDFRVDLIMTPERTLWPGHPKTASKARHG